MSARPTGYCFSVFGRRMGPWRARPEEARADALDAGHASHDEFSATIYLDAGVEIWTTHDLVEIEARPVHRDVAPRRTRSAERYPERIGRIIARREGSRAA